MENTADDPRQFAAAADVGGLPDVGIPPGVDTLFCACISTLNPTLWLNEIYVTATLESLMDRGMGARNNTTNRSGSGPAVSIRSSHL